MIRIFLLVLLCGSATAVRAAGADTAILPWQPFGPALFAQAREQNKPLFLYLEAVWCHWCHVMQRQTFPDAGVQQRLRGQWLVARVDHDADPLLANRYRNYGWPALIFFNAEGQEVVKRAGFLGPENLSALLDAIVADPTPEQPAAGESAPAPLIADLPDETRARLRANHRAAYDRRQGSLKLAQKYIDRDSVEYALRLAAAGDREEARRVRQTLDAARALIDPVWGGMYQYSTHGDWRHPHTEKIMRTQAGALRVYAMAYQLRRHAGDLRSARAIRDYLMAMLLDPVTGAFHGTQDADARPGEKATAYFALGDAARRKIGVPRIDPNLYAQENGLAIEALIELYRADGDADTLCAANAAMQWALADRGLADGRFRHGALAVGHGGGSAVSDQGRFLGDTLYMARAALALYGVTHDAQWLAVADRAGTAMAKHFAADGGGYLTALPDGTPLAPPRVTEENIAIARFYAALAQATATLAYLDDGRHALRWLARADVAFETLTEPGILMAADDLKAAESALSSPAAH